jgi:parvulin-like peptidyl-prolyl isomerase
MRSPINLTGVLLALAASPLLAQTNPAVNPAMLTVNGEAVYASDVSLVLQRMPKPDPGSDPAEQAKMVDMATRRVIEQKLIAQEARRLGLEADAAQVEKMVEAIARQSGGREALIANLSGAGTSLDRLQANLRELELVKRYVDTQVMESIEVTDDEVTAYYRAHPELFRVDNRVRARHILIKVEQGADEPAVERARARAEGARTRAVNGEDFAALATELSEGSSAPQGGDLGAFTRDEMVLPFAEAAFALEPGTISEVVRSPHGFHVIKVEERLPAGMTPVEEARPHLRRAIAAQKSGDAMAQAIKRLRDAAEIEFLIEPEAGAPPSTG